MRHAGTCILGGLFMVFIVRVELNSEFVRGVNFFSH